MALVFRWYLGQSSHWAINGNPARLVDYQIWCGPAMGAFNAWAAGSFLEPIENRTVSEIGLNLLYGAAALTRAQQLRAAGCNVPQRLFSYAPRELKSRTSRIPDVRRDSLCITNRLLLWASAPFSRVRR